MTTLDPITIAIITILEHYFAQSDYRSGFYMFLEMPETDDKSELFGPCHPGHSWSQDYNLSRHIFIKFFRVIGMRYNSKSEYMNQIDPFMGKMYLSYYDRRTNRTRYRRNHDLADRILKSKHDCYLYQRVCEKFLSSDQKP